jgi:hypothetical protein
MIIPNKIKIITSNDSINSAENFIANPVNSYLLIKMLTKDLQNFVDILNNFDQLKSKIWINLKQF